MSDTNKVTKEKAVDPGSIVVNQIVIRPVDRSSKDIQSWRLAHQHAESVYHANRTRLYDLYEDVILDAHLTGIIEKRISAVLNKPLHFDINGKRSDDMENLIESEVFRDIMIKLMESKFWGISGMEFIPGEFLHFEEIPRKHIKPDLMMISKEQSGEDGFPYNGVSNLWIVGKRKDLGLLLKCSPYALWKRGNMADWAQYVEIFGQPVRIIKYDAYDLKTKMELQQVLDESGSSLAVMIPKQADFEMVDGKQSNGDGKLQSALKDACNQEMSVAILGNTETTVSSSSSGYAQSKEHGKQQMEVTKSDLKFVANCLNSPQFMAILQSYGLPVKGGRFSFEEEIDLQQLRGRKEIDDFVSTKVPVADDYWYETYGIPKPENYDQLKAEMQEKKAAETAAKKEDPAPSKKGTKKEKDVQDQQASNSTRWKQFKAAALNFFRPGHED